MEVLQRSEIRPVAVLAVSVAAVALAAAIARSPQLALTAVLCVLTYGLYATNRRAAFALVWVVWLLAPGVRRVLGLSGFVQTDPLSVAPLLVTGLVAALEWTRRPQPPPVKYVVGLVVGGWFVGLPIGLTVGPEAAIYNLIASSAPALAFVIGWHEPARRVARLSLVRVLGVLGPPLAAYGIAQWVLPLPSWDRAWLDTVAIASFGAPDGQGVRVFSTLNAPGILAPVLALALLWCVARRRPGLGTLLAAGLLGWALALTYVRSAWVALVPALVVFALVGRRAAVTRIALPVLTTMAIVGALAPTNPTAAAIAGRFDTLGALGEDTSVQARTTTTLALVPASLALPLGHGLGTAGEGSKLNGAAPLRAPDNGYLSLLYQVGPIGALLVLGGLGLALRIAVSRARRVRVPLEEGPFVVAVIAFLLVFMISGDHFYGVMGTALWYMLGAASGALWQAPPAQAEAAAGSA
jgi:putative inorganic carbon (HCO3(-)) transporter